MQLQLNLAQLLTSYGAFPIHLGGIVSSERPPSSVAPSSKSLRHTKLILRWVGEFARLTNRVDAQYHPSPCGFLLVTDCVYVQSRGRTHPTFATSFVISSTTQHSVQSQVISISFKVGRTWVVDSACFVEYRGLR